MERVIGKPKNTTIWTHDEAMMLVEAFEDVLEEYNIRVPSPEDEDGDRNENDIGLYGSTYSDLLDEIENRLINVLKRSKSASIVCWEFSGRV